MANSIESRDDARRTEQREARQLIEAAKVGDLVALESMVASGCRIQARDEDGDTALMYASAFGEADVLVWLLEKGACADSKNEAGSTALMDAARLGWWECVKVLVNAGCDMDCADCQGDTALMLVVGASEDVDEDCGKCAAILLEAGCDLAVEDPSGRCAEERARVSGAGKLEAMIAAETERRILEKSVAPWVSASAGKRI
jgi:ankyrin repeat protein